eukprot:7412536-Pyramimonas_sp.AAC.1
MMIISVPFFVFREPTETSFLVVVRFVWSPFGLVFGCLSCYERSVRIRAPLLAVVVPKRRTERSGG